MGDVNPEGVAFQDFRVVTGRDRGIADGRLPRLGTIEVAMWPIFFDQEVNEVRTTFAGNRAHGLCRLDGDGAVIYPLGQMVPILQTSPGNFSLIILNKGAVPNGMQGAPGTQWIVKTSVAGHHAIVAISPRFAGQSGNLQILATGPHGHLLTYTVGLVSDKSRYTPKLSFYRNHAAGIPLLPTSPSQQTVVGGTPPTLRATTAAPKVVASHLHVDWMMQCVTGQCGDLMPKTVASTGLQTFVHFRTPLKMPPMVLPENPQGHSWYAPSSLVGGARTLVVNASPYRLDLLQPLPKHGITEVRLTQGDHPEGSE